MKVDPAGRARALIGTRFRPQGRSPQFGLDCVGLVICSFDLPAHSIRCDYRLRGDHKGELLREMGKWFRRIARSQSRAGDALLMQVASDQVHLGVVTPCGFLHADLRRGKVVESPGRPEWPIVAVFRRRARGQG